MVERKRTAASAQSDAAKSPALPEVDDAAAIPEAVTEGVSVDIPASADSTLLVATSLDSEAVYSRRHSGVSDTPEPSSMLTDARLLDVKEKPVVPLGWWQRAIFELTFHTVNLGDSRFWRARKNLISRIATPVDGDTRFVPVLTRKGGVGKTTTTTLLLLLGQLHFQ